jgi:6-phosphogluconolactonase
VHIHRIEAESLDLPAECYRYESILPKSIDLLILSVGEDGHIASLFPHRNLVCEKFRKVIHVKGVNQHLDRITVTPLVIQRAHHVFVMAIGQEKRALYEAALLEPDNIDAIPARLVLDRTWIFGEW